MSEPFAYSLEQVADLTGLPLRALQDGCRANPPTVPHSRVGRTRVMTRDHIARLLAANEVTPGQPEPDAETLRVQRANEALRKRHNVRSAA